MYLPVGPRRSRLIDAEDLDSRQDRFADFGDQFEFQFAGDRHVVEGVDRETLSGCSARIDRHIFDHRPALQGDVEFSKRFADVLRGREKQSDAVSGCGSSDCFRVIARIGLDHKPGGAFTVVPVQTS